MSLLVIPVILGTSDLYCSPWSGILGLVTIAYLAACFVVIGGHSCLDFKLLISKKFLLSTQYTSQKGVGGDGSIAVAMATINA